MSSLRSRTPTIPAACSAAVLSVTFSGHVVGSAVPASQARARTVVGLVPVNWTRRRTTAPLEAGNPVSMSLVRLLPSLRCARMKIVDFPAESPTPTR